MNANRIFIVVPAFNESSYIGTVLRDLRDHGFTHVVVVDDGSADDTGSLAEQYATVLRHPVNRGMGAALRTGTQYALAHGADVIVHFDADGQHLASDIEHIVAPLFGRTADIVLGSRYLRMNAVPWTKKILIHAPAILFQFVVTGIKLTDAHNGFRAMSREAAQKIVIEQDRMAHNTEIIAQIKKNRLRYVELPVTISYHEYGQGLSGAARIVRDLFVKYLLR